MRGAMSQDLGKDDPTATTEVDLRSLGRALWAKKALILGPTLLAAAAALFFTGSMKPLYLSEARVLVESADSVYTRPGNEQQQSAEREADELTVQSQVQLFLSRDLAKAVTEDLGLANLPEFGAGGGEASFVHRILVLFGLSRDPLRMSGEERVLNTFSEKLNVFSVAKSRVIAAQFSSEDPDLAAKVANAVTERYLQMQQAAKQATTRQASTWLASEISDLSHRVATAEAKVEEFRTGKNLFLGSNNASITTQQLSELSSDLARARSQQSDARAKAQSIQDALKAGRPIESLDLANSGLIGRLAEQRVALATTIARDGRTYLPAHPRMKELSAQLTALDQQIRDEARKLARAFENEADVAAARVASVQATIDDEKKVVGSANEQDVQLRALEREAKAQRDLLEMFLSRYRDAAARERIDAIPADGRIISRAAASNTPYWPKPVPIVVLAALATLVLLSVGVVASEFMVVSPDPAGRRPAPEDLARRRLEPALAAAPSPRRSLSSRLAGVLGRGKTTPQTPEAPVQAAAAAATAEIPDTAPPEPETAESLQVFGRLKGEPGQPLTPQMDIEAADLRLLGELASHLAAMPGGEGALNILTVGAVSGVDAGTVALSLARALAGAGRKTILVDAAGDSPVLDAALPAPAGGGLADLIAGDVSFGEAIQRDRSSAAHLIPHGVRGGLNVPELQRIGVVFDALGLTYDFVVVVSPSAERREEVAELARRTDAAILVAVDAAAVVTNAAHNALVANGIVDVVVLLTPETTVRERPALSTTA